MNWARTMAGNAENAANNRLPSDDSVQDEIESGSWDLQPVWLTRMKQPRDGRQRLPERSAMKAIVQAPLPRC